MPITRWPPVVVLTLTLLLQLLRQPVMAASGNLGPYCSATMTSSLTPGRDATVTLDLINRILAVHNMARQNTTPPATKMPLLVWNDALAVGAAAWAATCPAGATHSTTASRTNLEGFSYVGENIVAGPQFEYDGFVYSAQQWVKEVKDYTYAATCGSTAVCGACTSGAQCGHYTQVVWADTTDVGCGWARCAAGTVMSTQADMYVCRYGPGGNYYGQPPYAAAASYPTACTNVSQAAVAGPSTGPTTTATVTNAPSSNGGNSTDGNATRAPDSDSVLTDQVWKVVLYAVGGLIGFVLVILAIFLSYRAMRKVYRDNSKSRFLEDDDPRYTSPLTEVATSSVASAAGGGGGNAGAYAAPATAAVARAAMPAHGGRGGGSSGVKTGAHKLMSLADGEDAGAALMIRTPQSVTRRGGPAPPPSSSQAKTGGTAAARHTAGDGDDGASGGVLTMGALAIATSQPPPPAAAVAGGGPGGSNAMGESSINLDEIDDDILKDFETSNWS